jgi:hypothetical protein
MVGNRIAGRASTLTGITAIGEESDELYDEIPDEQGQSSQPTPSRSIIIWSIRVSRDITIIVHRTGTSRLLGL